MICCPGIFYRNADMKKIMRQAGMRAAGYNSTVFC